MIGKKKVLILSPSPLALGGVTNYCNNIFKYYTSELYTVKRFIMSRRFGKKSNILLFFTTISDFIRMYLKLFDKDYVLVHLNPSLETISVLRDTIFLLIAKLHSKKVLVFWRGWDMKFAEKVENDFILFRLFRSVFNKADSFVVLASSYEKKLKEWGFNQKVFIETTAVDDSLLDGFDPARKIMELKSCRKLRILFLSRLQVNKGIIETIDAFSMLDQIDRDVELVIAGDGPDGDLVRKKVEELGDDRIKLVGYVRGDKKREILGSSHLMCFPSYHGEGLPNVILEAIAFGLPVLTTRVGGIIDIIEEGENGYYCSCNDMNSISGIMRNIILDKEGMARMSMNNYNFAQRYFLASIVTKRIDNIYKEVINT